MKRLASFTLLLLLAMTTSFSSTACLAPRHSLDANSLRDSLNQLLGSISQRYKRDIQLSIGIIKDGKVFFHYQQGKNRPQAQALSRHTALYLASTSKSLTGTFAAILNQRGVIDLDRSLAYYLPDLHFDDPRIQTDKITIRSLLTHTHGIKNNDAVVWTAFLGAPHKNQLYTLLKKYSSALPDSGFVYSNLGAVLYSLVVEKVMQMPWQKAMAELLFKPLGMQHTTAYFSVVKPKNRAEVIDFSTGKAASVLDKADNSMTAAGGHFSTVDDLLRYLQFFISDGNSVPGLLPEQAVITASSPLVTQTSTYQSYERFGYGLGWEQSRFNGELLVSRMGGYSGISSHLSFMKAHRLGIVVWGNQKGMEPVTHLIANYIYNTLLNKANKNEILTQNLILLRKSNAADEAETRAIKQAMDTGIVMDKSLAGHYDGGDKSGLMTINAHAAVRWGNLKGHLYLLSDTTGIINFQTMVRSFSLKKENGRVVGVFSNERYFKHVENK